MSFGKRFHSLGAAEFLSCEGIVISSSSVGVSNSTLPSSDNFTSPVSCCNMFLEHGENFLHSALPLDPPKLNPGHGHQNVADPSKRGIRRDDYWFNGLFNYTEDTSPTQPQSVGGNYSPEIAPKPRLTYIIITVIQFRNT